MKLRVLAAVLGGYAAAVFVYYVWQAQAYRNSFEPLVPYTHAMQPTEPPSETTAVTTTSVRMTCTSTATTVQTTATTATAATAVTTVTAASAAGTSSAVTTAAQTTTTMTETVMLTETEAVRFPLDLNTAGLEELCALPDIGTETAQAILDYRAAHGCFYSREELLSVPGIGKQRYQAIYALLLIENELPVPEDAEPPEEAAPTEPPTETEPAEPPVINLNTADLDTLLLLPDCGETEAEAILELRNRIGIFHNPMELVMADEISDALYLQWEPYLAVDDAGNTQLPVREEVPETE
ncbi:MAG: helix-hairpin-helix domain-containing protein [Oscillospiraceae bacterium]|nr:helix-hairpin-helix domain-containing protein [Oscillospiraceae bacterium]